MAQVIGWRGQLNICAFSFLDHRLPAQLSPRTASFCAVFHRKRSAISSKYTFDT
jgi:hypothetical protein